jgi:hypothetical protein
MLDMEYRKTHAVTKAALSTAIFCAESWPDMLGKRNEEGGIAKNTVW